MLVLKRGVYLQKVSLVFPHLPNLECLENTSSEKKILLRIPYFQRITVKILANFLITRIKKK